MGSTNYLQRKASWVIVDIATGEGVFETFSATVAAKVNTSKYRAVPILEYLGSINGKTKN